MIDIAHKYFLTATLLVGGLFTLNAYSSEMVAMRTMKQRIADADFYGVGEVKWGAVAETGYGHATLFNYSVMFEGEERLVCTNISLAPGQSALIVIAKTDVKRPKGCAKNSAFIPAGRFDTFAYAAFDNLLDDKRWISLPPSTKENLGCKEVSKLYYDGSAKDHVGKTVSNAGIAPPYEYFLWADFASCLKKP